MIGRADIEGSKSNVAMNAWLPQASYPCVGFPLSVPVLSRLFDAREGPEGPQSVPRPARDDPLSPRSSSSSSPTADGFGTGTPCPALRANPFPEVTDPFCRLPLPTLFHRPEAVHLGDLAVMSTTGDGTRSSEFSRAAGRGHHGRAMASRWTLPPTEPFPGWAGC
ncbi:UNVERIFIED_CONTAM: hypothetical protein Slati_3830100 [Sesamum latifolium]|uniref:Uncharacterized protein n=1 Tax=Sesamum latifolium TaxID=2727402 RepID=A0AAW2TKQ2_9LAMI